MRLWEILLLAVGLAMDAFAVSICKGLTAGRAGGKQALTAGAYFGAAQAAMPLLGYFLGVQFYALIAQIDHWIAFALLSLIGLNMLRGAKATQEAGGASFGVRAMLPLAVATSIDALAVGITFAFLQVDLLLAAGIIGAVTFVLSALGVRLGGALGVKWKTGAAVFGGVILILLGCRILLSHLGVFG